MYDLIAFSANTKRCSKVVILTLIPSVYVYGFQSIEIYTIIIDVYHNSFKH